MAVSGFLLGVFILVHLAGNATIFAGGAVFLSYAEHLHALGPFLKIAEIALLFIFSLHLFFGVSLYVENLAARPDQYAVKKSDGGRSVGSMTMPYTGAIIFLFLGIHLTTLSFFGRELSPLDLLRGYLGQPMMVGIYVTGLLALTLHLSHGFWSMFQTFGINHPRYNRFLRSITLLVAVAAGVIYILIPCLIYFRGIPN